MSVVPDTFGAALPTTRWGITLQSMGSIFVHGRSGQISRRDNMAENSSPMCENESGVMHCFVGRL